ncbi:glycogen/starch/alpha-glucan family phosphorylase [Maridesulfovibrio hydrothermalis]|uniref:Alpha-1,4 glucan phosphorylase n=1 Tax=Maridesulfovibrio hydrothermalis AM13 = DSM 14728 TaxID=1121451 RepID=L0RF05_9BACT|nr:glycogen/starch/alpha-glucan family phosphorylase [Maridesulfovibrio hydrothermalis]CCO25363.1 Glycogen phosphorylase [Maridesulfovibrio hydrothermalis AM13 = DSM 14728]
MSKSSFTIKKKNDRKSLTADIRDHVVYSLSKEAEAANERDMGKALSLALRDRLVERMIQTRDRYRNVKAKRMYYFSIEYLLGRCLGNSLCNMELLDLCEDIFKDMGYDLDEVRASERDPALGNGGLGRLAACFLDSLATLDMPGCGYGIHYEYGLFRQSIHDGYQKELADYWMMEGMPLQLERPDQAVIIPLYGKVVNTVTPDGDYLPMWMDWDDIIGVPYDIPIVGYGGKTVNYLRLFAARASQNFDMEIFNHGDYIRAVQRKVESEMVSKVLYPTESVSFGKELRLVQEYFLVACGLRDITRRFLAQNDDFDEFASYVAIQLNDTHPALTVVELMRFLVDEKRIQWGKAWEITRATCAYTNHTLLPEALEQWSVSLLEKVLPRHLQIIYEINKRFLKKVAAKYPGDSEKVRRMSLVTESGSKKVRMANLAVIGSHSVNGVSALHSKLVKTRLFPDFYELEPGKFNNKTNGVTPRRWLLKSNPVLARLLTDAVGKEWITDLSVLKRLDAYAQDSEFKALFMKAKRENKVRLGNFIHSTLSINVSPDSIFDIQAKRIHEYKRQLLNVLHIMHMYIQIVDHGNEPLSPRTFIFAGKAAPGYWEAKQIIKLIHSVADVVNNNPRTKDLLKVAFIPDYRVSLAEKIIPACDLSEQISTAGTEASGTGNMKFAMNGALTIGTYDGANIEMLEEVGEDNFYLFGLRQEEVEQTLTAHSYRPREVYNNSFEIRQVLGAILENRFSPDDHDLFRWIVDKLLAENEQYMHLADFQSYINTQGMVDKDYASKQLWAQKAILNTARMGKFSTDRTMQEYAEGIWNIKSIKG